MGSMTESANSSNGTLHALEHVPTTPGPSCRSQLAMHDSRGMDTESPSSTCDEALESQTYDSLPSSPRSTSGVFPGVRMSSRSQIGTVSAAIPIGTALCAGVANLASHILEVNTAPEQLARAADASPVKRRVRGGRASRRHRQVERSTDAADLVVPNRRSSLTLTLQEASDLARGVLGLTEADRPPLPTQLSAARETEGSADESLPLTIDTNVPTEIGRTLSTSTAGTDQSSTVESSGTAATSEAPSSIDQVEVGVVTSLDGSKIREPSSEERPRDEGAERGLASHSEGRRETTTSAAQSVASFTKMRRLHALYELVETERSYADDLGLLVEVFFRNLGDQPFFSERSDRIDTVQRNAAELLLLHREMADNMERILEEHGVSPSDVLSKASGSHIAASAEAEAATSRIAKYFGKLGPRFAIYQDFCSRHGEALSLVRDAERRHGGDDWRSYERCCSNILRGFSRSPTPRNGLSRANSNQGTSSAGSLGIAPMTPTATIAPLSPLYDHARAPSSPDQAFGASFIQLPLVATPASETSSTGGMLRDGAARLLFSDYFVKPIQRLCLYPVVLSTLLKYSDDGDPSHAALSEALATMRHVAEDVDEAGKEREKVLMAALISSRVEATLSVTPTLIASLGHCLLAGALDVMHHHSVLQPLTAPLRFKYFAVFVYEGFVLFAKVRKPSVYEPKFWFPLWAAKLYDGKQGFFSRLGSEEAPATSREYASVLPYSCRLICLGGHNFELVASSAREKEAWVATLAQAIAHAPFSPPKGGPSSFPSSLGDYSIASDDLRVSGLAEEHSDAFLDADPLGTFLTENAAAPSPADILVRHSPLSARAAVDRAMIFSEAIVAARAGAMRERGDQSSNTPSIGAAVGAAIGGLARAAARKAPRRASTLFADDERPVLEDGTPRESTSPTLVASPTKLDTQLAPASTMTTASPTWKVRTARSRPPLLSVPAQQSSSSTNNSTSPIQSVAQPDGKRNSFAADAAVPRRKSFVDDRRSSSSRPPSTRNNSSMTNLKNMWTSRSRTSSAEFDLNELTARAAAGADAHATGQYAHSRASVHLAEDADRASPVELLLTDMEEQPGNDGHLTFTSRASTLKGAFSLRRRQRSGSASSDFGPPPLAGTITPYNQSRSVVSSRESLNVTPSPHKLAARLAQSSRDSLRRSFTLGSKGKQRAMSLPSAVDDDGALRSGNPNAILSAESVASRESLSPIATPSDRGSGHTSPSLSADDGHVRIPSAGAEDGQASSSPGPLPALTLACEASTVRPGFLNGTLKNTRRLSTRFLGSRSTPPLSGLRSVAETTQEHAFGVMQPSEPNQTTAAVKLANAPERERTTSTTRPRSSSLQTSASQEASN
ncbi:Invasion-inducing protein TIAM1/CDC24 and related RhoGEF GTPases [Ceraceosorus bombacis]|uniref:Invasion-inducing protein TIAM1/CDC24 and related RhoGEF GTPases n=1 Tax=Ceraceosorus bombacis TaxID=401625 RepID=A0A0P1B9D2_9BASI|nr:Invasion-inducing protein TIAM1/CDC24 and related RhoGEF GTPases [Ceraceosorus bombacis]